MRKLLQMLLEIVRHGNLPERGAHGGYANPGRVQTGAHVLRFVDREILYVLSVHAAQLHARNAVFLHGLNLAVQHFVRFVRESGKDKSGHSDTPLAQVYIL